MPPGLKNRFGGSLGGPIIHDKAFFFGNYEAQRQKVGTAATATVPTPHLIETCLSGNGCDFSEYAAVMASGGQLIWDNSGATPVPYAGNIMPQSKLSPQALALLKYMQPYKPNSGVPGTASYLANNFSEGGTGLFNSNMWTERVDWTINDKMHAFERFSRFWDTLSGNVMFGDAGGPGFGINGYGGNSNGANDSLASGMDIAVNPKLLTDFRLAYYRYNVIDSKFDQSQQFANTLGIPGINTGNYFTSGSPGFEVDSAAGATALIGAGLGINRCNCPLTEKEDQFQIVNNWTKIWGNHSFKMGADLRYARNLRVPSDVDRAGQMNFHAGPTSDNGSYGLGWATFMQGLVPSFGRYVSVSTNAKEFQKRTFFYAQDTWRATHNLTLNLGLRYELYFPETVNAVGNGSLMNLADGYMHVAGIGGIGSNMGWGISYAKMFSPRLGLTYQLDPKTVIRAGYGRSFDIGVFGSIFGHVVTQNLPVLANQQLNEPGGSTASEFTLAQGPPAFVFPKVPSNGLLPAEAFQVSPKARPNPLHFPTLDAWNLSVQRAITPTMSLTIAYVGNKGTHTLGDGDSNNTNPNEAALSLPGQYSVTGQTLTWDPNGPGQNNTPIPSNYSGGVSSGFLLQRYYGGSLAACKDANYPTPTGEANITPGMCGWTQGISYYGNDQNTEFDALQITLQKQYTNGLQFTANYQWASAFDEQSQYYTWSHTVTHMRDSNVRNQQLVGYGSYDLPFGHGKQYLGNANRLEDLAVGGWQLSTVANISGGLPWSVGYDQFAPGAANPEDCYHNVGGTAAPCRPNASGHMATHLTAFDPASRTRSFFKAQPRTGGIFSFPGLDVIGNAGANTYRGPNFWSDDAAISKQFTVHESITTTFRMDAFNAFNHINPGNPNNGDVFVSQGTATGDQANNISGEAAGCYPGGDCGPRQLEFSLRVQF
ncbi:MAG: TonB-dependent receptor domain-containing protein [Acidobacteriota bacterium]